MSPLKGGAQKEAQKKLAKSSTRTAKKKMLSHHPA
jgi:hypothetical protein